MGNTSGRTPKFESIGYFCGDLVTIALLIEIFHMVPFPPIVLNEVSVYIGHASGHAPLTAHRAYNRTGATRGSHARPHSMHAHASHSRRAPIAAHHEPCSPAHRPHARCSPSIWSCTRSKVTALTRFLGAPACAPDARQGHGGRDLPRGCGRRARWASLDEREHGRHVRCRTARCRRTRARPSGGHIWRVSMERL